MTSKKQLLDPIGTVCRLIGLYFNPKDTKIGIASHVVELQIPYDRQWLERTWKKDNRNNIAALFQVYVRLCEWYIHPLYLQTHGIKIDNIHITSSTTPTHKVNTQCGTVFLTSGSTNLEELRNSGQDNAYIAEDNCSASSSNHGSTTASIDEDNDSNAEIKKENGMLDDKDIKEYWECMKKLCKYLCMALNKLQYTYLADCDNTVIAIQYYINLLNDAVEGRYEQNKLPVCLREGSDKNLLDYEKLKKLWNFKKVKEVCDEYTKCFDAMEMSAEAIRESDEDPKEKIAGYLLSVDRLLTISDKKFKKLIDSSNKN